VSGVRALLPTHLTDADVHAHYAANWVADGGVRVNFIASVDGAVTAGGLSRGLQTPGDNRVFAALRDLADVVLVGAGTARAEGYGVIRARASIRHQLGFAAELPTAVVSRALDLDATSGLFGADPRTIVLTCAASDAGRRAALGEVADVVVCGDTTVDLALGMAALRDRGHTRILAEGGPHLFADLARAAVLDEVCLSISPVLAGPGAGRILAGNPFEELIALTLTGLLEEDGALFCRYRARMT